MSRRIEEPYVVAQLSKPLDADNGRTLAAPVYSLYGSKKRKRHEIVVAVDGESINIYNTQNQSISSSYALPPQSFLAAPPCSVYCKRTKPLPSQRQTYFVTCDALYGSKLRLLNITEDLGKPHNGRHEPRVPAKKERGLRGGSIVGLDVVQGEAATTSSVLVSYDNGSVDCLLSDLSASRWEYSGLPDGVQVEHAFVLDIATARKGLLKGREDILAMLDSSSTTLTNENTRPLLLQVLRSDACRKIRILALGNTLGEPIQSRRPPVEELVIYNLPGRHRKKDEEARYDFHSGTGMLYQCLGGHLKVFDLSGTLPNLVAELGRKSSPRVDSFARLSTTTVLTLNSERLAVTDIKFGSILSSLDYPSASPGADVSSLQIVSQFTELGTVVALSSNNLVAFHIGEVLDDGKRTKAREPLLIDVLAKGSKVEEREPATLSKKQLKKRQRWETWRAKIDALFRDEDMHRLETLVAEDIRVRDDNTTNANDDETHAIDDDITNGAASSSDELAWDLAPHTYDPQHTDHNRALYILGSLFTRANTDDLPGPSSCKLRLKFLPKNILRWLTMAGYMTHAQIDRALRNSAGESSTQSQVAPGDVMAALIDADPSFTTMCEVLSLPIQWDLVEVVQGLRMLIRSFESQTYIPRELAASPNKDIVMANGDEETRLQAEVDAATRQLDDVQNMLDTGLANRSRACQILLFRLHAFPHNDVARVMRTLLSQESLIFFIAILRLELGDAGWTRMYVEAEQAAQQEDTVGSIENLPDLEPSNHAIRTIAELCSCAVDAIGLSGWLVGLSGDVDATARLVAETRNEVSAAAEGIVGVEMLDMMLREIVKTAGSVQQMGHKLKRKRGHEEEATSEEALLPLGGRLAPQQVKSLTSQDGTIKSKQAIAEEKSRRVGKYSFEQIRL